MREKFNDIYRIESSRKPNWYYRSDGYYFVTICTGGRGLYFGDVLNKQMIFSDIGQKAYEFWLEIPKHFKFVRLDDFQIMSNHIHGLIEINHNLLKEEKNSDNKHNDRRYVETPNLGVLNLDKQKLILSDNDQINIIVPKMSTGISAWKPEGTDLTDETSKLAVSTPPKPNGNRSRAHAALEKW